MSLFANVLRTATTTDRRLEQAVAALLIVLSALPAAALLDAVTSAHALSPALATLVR